ncbi:unnamed protein product [Fraxinus pennsylvanica]|uniref:Uncharacterized protein n=1 Tax=Fraxinus pennsylvanica TaxID=56036 RepID=A0AAD1YKI3_9LAMI|nr:unnamed protein product [Fraxinus pennsylvanica]
MEVLVFIRRTKIYEWNPMVFDNNSLQKMTVTRRSLTASLLRSKLQLIKNGLRRSEANGSEDSDDENRGTRKIIDSGGEDGEASELDGGWDSEDTRSVNHGNDSGDSEEAFDRFAASKMERE